MAPPPASVDTDSLPPSSPSPHSFMDNAEKNIQPYFVLHKCSSLRPRTRRKIDMSPKSALRKQEGPNVSDYDEEDRRLDGLRIEAFHSVWSGIDATLKGVLRDMNAGIFNDVDSWVHESFKVVRSRGKPGFAEATRPYPVVTDALSKQIFTGLVYTKNMEFVDDQLTFEELGDHLKSSGCLVANMSSVDFSAKNGIGGCLTRLLRQFLMVTLDGADMSIMASWYAGHREYTPVVVIIEDMERCCGSVLSDFILMLSEWVVKIPVILIMGIATTLDAPSNLISSNALLRLCTSKFILGSPAERMDAIVEAVLLRPCSRFSVSYKVALFMKDYFLNHDGTLTSFIRALKIACMKHFSTEPLGFMLNHLDTQDDLQQMWKEDHTFMRDIMLKYSSQLSSCRRVGEPTSENFAHALADLKRVHNHWATVLMCLYEAGKSQKIRLLDLYSEALDPDPHRWKTSIDQKMSSASNEGHFSQHGSSYKRASICQAVQKVRDLPPAALRELLNSWERRADDISEIQKKVKELQSVMMSTGSKSSGCDVTDIALRHSSRRISSAKDSYVVNEKAVALIDWMIRDHLKPIEGLPFHEILCYKKVDKLQAALLGDPRKKIQADLLEFEKYMCCSCCSNRNNSLLPSLHDTSILCILAQEHGDVINVHDWYQSYKAIAVNPSTKARSKSRRPSTPKKKKDDHSHGDSEAAIQARFCKAVSELQITGLLRMPSKRRPDYVQRVAFEL